MSLRNDLYYYCRLNKNPHMGKIRACCSKGCPHLQTRPRKKHRERRARKRTEPTDEEE